MTCLPAGERAKLPAPLEDDVARDAGVVDLFDVSSEAFGDVCVLS